MPPENPYKRMQKKEPTYYRAGRYLMQCFQRNERKPSEEEMDALWLKICEQADRESRNRQRRLRLRIVTTGVAASLLAAFFLGPWSPLRDASTDIEDVATGLLSQLPVMDETDRPLLVMSPDRVIPLENNTQVKYSKDGKVFFRQSGAEEKEEGSARTEAKASYNQLIVPKGKHTRLLLADGSELYVNSGTRVVYPSVFADDRREIFVDGEIFLDVKHDESRPFHVKTAGFEVRVLGTAFNVCAYNESSTAEVVLLRGRVHVADKQGGGMDLQPDQLARLENRQLAGCETVDAESYVSWTKGILQLRGEPLRRLLPRLEHYYGVPVRCEESLGEIIMRGYLDINCALPEALESIAIATSTRIVEDAEGYLILPDSINLMSNPNNTGLPMK